MGKKQEKEEKKLMVKNGGIVLEELISSGNGKCNPIRSYSAKQLRQATNNFESPCYNDNSSDKRFKAVLDHRSVLIKIHGDFVTAEMACRDIAISSQMSSHGRVLKLLGCCLELPVPALVYEDPENGHLNRFGGLGSADSGSSSSSLSWKIRLRVAKDVAHALAYLHTAFSRPIIHRNLKPVHVFLGKDFVPKLSEFSRSISIPEGETEVQCDDVMGTFGFSEPEYFRTGLLTEKSDVYSFGVFLYVLLTGKPGSGSHELACFTTWDEEKTWDEIVDPKLMEEAREMNYEEELRFRSESQACLELALTCVREQRDDRPTMIDVAKELKRIQSSRP